MRSNLFCECLFLLPKHFLVDSNRLHISILNYVTAYDAEFYRFISVQHSPQLLSLDPYGYQAIAFFPISVKESIYLHLFLVTLTSSGDDIRGY